MALPLSMSLQASRPGPIILDTDLGNLSIKKHQTFELPLTPPLDAEEFCTQDHSGLLFASSKPVAEDEVPLVAVIGVGYVGVHLVESFSRAFDTLGFDISEKRIQDLEPSFSENPRVRLTSSRKALEEATHFLISVPTLLLPNRSIDSSYLRSALETVGAHARPGSTIVIESSVAIGMTRELLGPLAKSKGFFAGMSPERVDPGRTEPAAYAIPKIISGLDDVIPGSLNSIMRLYSAAFDQVVPVSSPEVAEMTKLYENCQRMICIAYANEMADACQPHGIDPFEVCAAAATKPFGYMPYAPGPGVGGHCIPINPYYLLSNSAFPLLSAATETMWRRPSQIASRAIETLTGGNIAADAKPRVLVVGMGFKPGQSTLSNSPGLDMAKNLSISGKVDVVFADTLVTQEALPQVLRLRDDCWTRASLESFNMIMIAVRQVGFDYNLLDELQNVRIEWWCQKS